MWWWVWACGDRRGGGSGSAWIDVVEGVGLWRSARRRVWSSGHQRLWWTSASVVESGVVS